MTIAQLLNEMKQSEQFAHEFAGASVGANSGTIAFNGANVKNPWKKETHNLTLQGKIVQENPTLAKRLKAEAGVG
jgi:hypothetical protein